VFPVITLLFSAAVDGRELKVDEDCFLVAAITAGSSLRTVVSKDPKHTISNVITAPAAAEQNENILVALVAASINAIQVPIEGGRSLFVSASGAGCVVLYFQLTPLTNG
jgi:hypothetical protein